MKRFLLTLLALPVCALANDGLPTEPYIYVEGRAEIEKPADTVTLTFELSAMQPEQAAANKLVQEQAEKVFAYLKSVGVADNDVIASDITSEAEYERDEETMRKTLKLVGYKVTRPFAVKVREIAKFPQIVDQLLALKVHEFSGIEEGLSNAKEIESQVWDKAVANARERAERTLKPTGASLISIFAISPVAFPQIRPSIFGSSGESRGQEYMQAIVEEKGPPSQYRLAPVSISQRVHIIFLISRGR